MRWETDVSSPGWRRACAARTAAIGSTPSNRAGTDRALRSQGVELGPPRREELRGRDGLVAHPSAPYFAATSILVIFSFRSPPGGRELDLLAALAAQKRLSDRRLVGELHSVGFASAEPTIVYFVDLPPLP